ncbi:MAG: Hpt domain-containing protein, partial [Amphritea sp.]|nr:Hpt domain-containing protein [Amphritea sp.]
MSLDVDQEILEDFLVEAGEILELLSEQLVDLEQHPDDRELLNAIFRGFHTVKGGAGFLQLDPMVDCCHSAENLFDQLRNDALKVSQGLMDLVLQALDSVNAMFEAVRQGDYPDAADPQLLSGLNAMALGQVAASVPVASPQPVVSQQTEAAVSA